MTYTGQMFSLEGLRKNFLALKELNINQKVQHNRHLLK